MAYRGHNSGNQNLPVGSRLRPSIVTVALLISLVAPLQPAIAATESATPTSSGVPSASPTAKPTPKPTATKKAPKKSTKKKVRITPSPKPVWPPKGFIVNGDVYAKVPTSKELVGIISAQRSLALQIKKCTDSICGAIQVASATGCMWWEANSNIFGGDGIKLGTLTTAHAVTVPREIKTIISISPESAANGGRAKFTSVICHRDKRDTSVPTVKYEKVESAVTP
ncbi:unannotated protein [freshwater metagenome]|uniref:Unannotated protein n=1 Tax=freshwater metagenome TaxID=449393 RepID=A0A6J5Z7X4_9ZZZZ